MPLRSKDLLTIEQLSVEEINLILDTADSMKEISSRDIKKVPTLRGKTVINLFYEPSTRTRTSFEIAGKRLSADVVNISTSSSSVSKGETLKDTGKNLQAMSPDLVVIRHSAAGAPKILADALPASIINAGDGAHQHPTQALLDAFTIREKKGTFEGLTVSIIGDISHSRVARSNVACLTRLGARVKVYGPFTMIPYFVEELGVAVAPSMEEAIADADVIMMLRIQMERQSLFLFPTLREYSTFFGLNLERLKRAKKDVLIMHPGPVNRGVEIAPEVADGPYALILEQVANGVAVRMALLYLLIGK
jgi:aspartate carbamoyltransferase catalytic subunit